MTLTSKASTLPATSIVPYTFHPSKYSRNTKLLASVQQNLNEFFSFHLLIVQKEHI